MPEDNAEFPILVFSFTENALPITIGSLSGWFMFAAMMARPAAISLRTNSGVTYESMPNSLLLRFSLMATYSISGVMIPLRA